MKLIEIKQWIDSLPKEFLDFDVVNAKFGDLADTEYTYRIDIPITSLAVDEETKEILFIYEDDSQ